jgi:thioredoxin 1
VKPVVMFIIESCPHCQKALLWMEELKKENKQYALIQVNMIDEELHPDIAGQYDYYYVPTFYVDGAKIYEGATTKEIMQRVFEKACE